MTVYYGSPSHILSVLSALVFCFCVFFLLRRTSRKVSERVIFIMMLVNLIQHLFKWLIYPHHIAEGFTIVSTAYNMCAFLIIFSPIAMLVKKQFIRDAFFLFGSVAGIIAIIVPYWHIGSSPFTWEYLRYMICHVLLFTNSMLPLLLGIHKPSYKSIPFLGLMFIGAVGCIILNDTIFYAVGLFGEGMTLSEALRLSNPVWSFGPPENFSFILNTVKAIFPDFTVISGKTGLPIPLIWYAVPMYVLITLIAALLLTFLDRKNFKRDYDNFQQKRKAKKTSF